MSDRSAGGCLLRKLGCLGLLFTAGMAVAGARFAWQGLTNRQLTVVDYQDFVQQRPKAEWIKLTNTKMLVTDAIVATKFGSPTGLYLPVRGKDEAGGGPVHVLLKTQDPDTLKRVAALQSAGASGKSERELLGILSQDGIYVEMEVKGLAEKGTGLKDKELKKLRAAEKQLAEDFVIIDHGAEPHFFLALVFMLAGIGGFVVVWKLILVFGEEKEKPVPAAIPVAREVPPPQG
ncbi:MAG TPA: hypothetical protein PK280_11440 [Planctomycetota bacterium]|nr:hypothetical protein [Planctomycetota bacterium]